LAFLKPAPCLPSFVAVGWRTNLKGVGPWPGNSTMKTCDTACLSWPSNFLALTAQCTCVHPLAVAGRASTPVDCSSVADKALMPAPGVWPGCAIGTSCDMGASRVGAGINGIAGGGGGGGVSTGPPIKIGAPKTGGGGGPHLADIEGSATNASSEVGIYASWSGSSKGSSVSYDSNASGGGGAAKPGGPDISIHGDRPWWKSIVSSSVVEVVRKRYAGAKPVGVDLNGSSVAIYSSESIGGIGNPRVALAEHKSLVSSSVVEVVRKRYAGC